jgi:hypothetical protein
MLKTGNSIAFCLVAALGCISIAACSDSTGKASPSVVGTSGTLTLIAESSVRPRSDVSDGSGSALGVTGPIH